MTRETPAGKAFGLGTARRLLRRIQRGFNQFAQELATDLQSPTAAGDRQRQQLDEKEQERRRGVLPMDTRRSALNTLKGQHNERVAAINRRLAGGSIDVAQWRGLMNIEIRSLHFNGRVIAKGGVGALTPADIAAVEQHTAKQMAYLNRWAGQLAQQETISEAALNVRGRMYTGAVSETYEAGLAAALGVELPFMPADRTDCRTNCGCNWRIVELDGVGDFDAYWVRSLDDSCDTCITRERVCNPLQIRGGVYNLPVVPGLFSRSGGADDWLQFDTVQEVTAYIEQIAPAILERIKQESA